MRSDYFPVHAHSEFSILDGMGQVEEMVARVAKLGQPALALTDHGNMAGALRLYKHCMKAGIAPFIGSEFYVVTDVTDLQARERRYHLGMLALDFTGYQGLIRLSSRSHQRERFHRRPLIDFADLSELSLWYSNHIAVTTGCYFGLVLQNLIEHGDQAADAMIKTLASWFPHTFVEVQHHGIDRDEHGDDDLTEWLLNAGHRHSLPVVFGQDSHYCDRGDQQAHDLMKSISYFGDSDDNVFPGGPYHLPPTRLIRQKFDTKDWNRIEEGHGHLLDLHELSIPALDKYKFHVPSYTKKPLERLVNDITAAVRIKGESDPIMLALDGILQQYGLRAISGRNKNATSAQSGLRIVGGTDTGRSDSGSFVRGKEMRKSSASRAGDAGGQRSSVVGDNHALSARPRVHSGQPGIRNTGTTTVQGVQAGIGSEAQTYHQRLRYELDVIRRMHMADYFVLVADMADWCRRNNIVINARGSVNGSLVCFLLGITTIDPIQWGTSFDRFLSVARKKPPDIDMDVESGGRAALIAHLRQRFPTLVQIGTYGRIGITEQDDGSGNTEDKGSIFVQYAAAMRRKHGQYNGIQSSHRPALNRLAELHVRKSFGVHAAGLVLGTGSHKVEDYLATGLVASSNTTATQSVMEDVEEAGFMKLDVLGVRSLQTLNTALRNIGRVPNDWDWIPWDDKKTCAILRSGYCTGIFQFEGPSTARGGKEMQVKSTMDAIVCLALYRPALMSGGQKDRYLENRRKNKNRPYRLDPFFNSILNITYGVPVFQEQVMEMCFAVGMEFEMWNELMKAVKASNDKIGQYAIGIMNDVEPVFLQCCNDVGIGAQDARDAWNAIVGFTDYGFNRAHATSYGVMAYRSAYLKTHFPIEYMHALLDTWIGTDKERIYIAEARRHTKIGRPDVQKSDVSWSVEVNGNTPILRRGLQSIKGIGPSAALAIVDAREALPAKKFADIDEFAKVLPKRPVPGANAWNFDKSLNGKFLILHEAGAFGNLPGAPQAP